VLEILGIEKLPLKTGRPGFGLIEGFLLLCFVSSSVTASTLQPEVFQSSYACLGTQLIPEMACNLGEEGGAGPLPSPLYPPGYLTGPQASLNNFSASGQSGYGVLKSAASATFSNTSTAYDYASSLAAFEDVITISSPPFNGSTGYLYVGYNLDGQISSTGSGNAFAQVDVFGGPTFGQQWLQTYTSSTSGEYALPSPIQFVYGQPFGLYFDCRLLLALLPQRQ